MPENAQIRKDRLRRCDYLDSCTPLWGFRCDWGCLEMGKKKGRTSSQKGTISPPGESELHRQHERFIYLSGVAERVAKAFLIGSTIVLSTYFGIYKPMEVSAGKTTWVSYTQSLLGDFKIETWLAYGGTLAASGACFNERKQRLKERAEKDRRIRELETQIDPGVTSSGLNLDGTSSAEKS